MAMSRGFRLVACTLTITSLGELTVGAGVSSENFSTSLEPYWSMSQADMQLCSLRGELHKPLPGHTLHARANVPVEPAAAALVAHSSLVDMTPTEPIL